MSQERSVHITYFVHGTTTDNEAGISTGWNPGALSALGVEQSKQLHELINDREFDAIFCSDLKRAVDSAALTFPDAHVIQDSRLRECNYGTYSGGKTEIVDPLYLKYIDQPFPEGESMRDVEHRVRDLCRELLEQYAGKHIAFVAHQAPQLALEVIANKKTWDEAICTDWRRKIPKAWQPGWDYIITADNV